MGESVNLCQLILNYHLPPLMISFLGEYESTIDSKSRFLLPAAFKKQLPKDDGSEFVINRGFEHCLTLYPLNTWKPIFANISKLNDFDPKVRAFRRNFLNGAVPVQIDSAGRILLPKNLLDYASLDKDIVLVSAVNKIEIWDKTVYEKLITTMNSEDFSKIADEVMNPKQGPKDWEKN